LKPDRHVASAVTDSDDPTGPPGARVGTGPGTGGTGGTTPPATRWGADGDATAAVHAGRLERLRAASHLLDSSVPVPGTDYRIGLDPILGLLPVVGDLPGTVVAAAIVAEAAALGVPRETLARMLGVLFVDAVVGSVPVVGDLFDAAWKANERNMRLLETRVEDPTTASGDRRVLVGVGVAVVVAITAIGAGAAALAWWAATSGLLG
jgi:hypothetical protein